MYNRVEEDDDDEIEEPLGGSWSRDPTWTIGFFSLEGMLLLWWIPKKDD